jgi:hypothetical protein
MLIITVIDVVMDMVPVVIVFVVVVGIIMSAVHADTADMIVRFR